MIAWAALLSAAWAGDPTLEDVLDAVDAHFPLLVAAQAEAEAAAAARLGAAGWLDPTWVSQATRQVGPYDATLLDLRVDQATGLWGLRTSVGYGIGLGELPSYDAGLATDPAGELRVGATLPLLAGGFTDSARTGLRTAAADLRAAEAKVDDKRIAYAAAARAAWAKWIASGEKLRIARGMLDAANANATGVAARIRAGDLAPIDGVDADRVLAERRLKVRELEAEVAVAAAKLSLFWRDGAGRPLLPTGDPPPPVAAPPPPTDDPDAVLAAALDRRPELDALDAKLEAAEAKSRLAQVALLPKLDAKFDLTQPLGGGGDGLGEPTIKAGASLTAPLLQREARGKAGVARAEVDQVRAQRTYAADQVASELFAARARLDAAYARLGDADALVALARQVEDATRAAFQLGDRTLLDLYLREQARLKAELDRVDVTLERDLAWADWLAAQGLRR